MSGIISTRSLGLSSRVSNENICEGSGSGVLVNVGRKYSEDRVM